MNLKRRRGNLSMISFCVLPEEIGDHINTTKINFDFWNIYTLVTVKRQTKNSTF